MIRSISNWRTGVTLRVKYCYNILSLLQDRYSKENIKIYPHLFPLYLDKFIHMPFNERFSTVLIMDSYRTSQPRELFNQVVQHSLLNLDKYQNRQSLIALLNQMYHYKYNNKTDIQAIASRVFAIDQPEDSGISFFNLKFLIAIDTLVGLQHFDEHLFRRINFKKFRPVHIAMAIELFYQRDLHKRYPFVEELVDMFIACESFIPFADMHHLSYSIRKIDNEKYKKCYYRIRRRIQASMGGREDTYKQDVNPEIEESELSNRFRKVIEDKYSVYK